MKLSKTQRTLRIALVAVAAFAGFAAAQAADIATLAKSPAVLADPARVVSVILTPTAPADSVAPAR